MLSGTNESATPPVESPEVVDQQELPACTTSLDESTNSTQLEVETRDDTLLLYGRGRYWEKKIAVHLVRHFFLPLELDGKNVRGVGIQLPLDPLKMERIREIIFRFFPLTLTQQEQG